MATPMFTTAGGAAGGETHSRLMLQSAGGTDSHQDCAETLNLNPPESNFPGKSAPQTRLNSTLLERPKPVFKPPVIQPRPTSVYSTKTTRHQIGGQNYNLLAMGMGRSTNQTTRCKSSFSRKLSTKKPIETQKHQQTIPAIPA